MNAPEQVPVTKAAATPARPSLIGTLQREIDRLFDDFAPGFVAARDEMPVRCRMDVAETPDGLELTVEVPGLEEKDVHVSITDGHLTVSGEKRFDREEKDKTYRIVERGYGSFSRAIALPPGAKADDVRATLSKGVLKVTVPTEAKPQPKTIEVRTTA